MSTQSLHFKLFLTRFSFKQMHFFHYQLKLETFLFFLELFLILIIFRKKYSDNHCVKSVRIWSFSGPHLTAFGINTERYSVSLRIQSKYLKIWTRKTRNTNTFHKVNRFTSLLCIRKSAIQQSKLKIYIASVIFRALDGHLWTMLHKITFAYLSVTFGNFLKLYIWVFVKFLTGFKEHLFKGAPLNGCL